MIYRSVDAMMRDHLRVSCASLSAVTLDDPFRVRRPATYAPCLPGVLPGREAAHEEVPLWSQLSVYDSSPA
jgi:hypothetical protein